MVEVKVSPEMEILLRKAVLHRVVSELANRIHPNEKLQDIIKKGIFDNQYISEIVFNVMTKEDSVAAQIILTIDWDKHEVLARKEGSDYFELKKGVAVIDEVISVAEQVATIIDDIAVEYKDGSTMFSIVLCHDILINKERAEDVRKELGVTNKKKYRWYNKIIQKDTDESNMPPKGGEAWDFTFSHSSAELEEFSFVVKANQK